MINVGLPVMKLDREQHFKSKNSHSGNCKAVLNECMSERISSDTDIDRTLTDKNEFLAGTDGTLWKSGEALAAHYEEMAAEYKVTTKNGSQKGLRSDAGIAFAGIVKAGMNCPDYKKMSKSEQLKFNRAAYACIKIIYEKRGMKIDYGVIHVDEQNIHLHYGGHDPKYQLGKKLGLNLYRALNVTEFPELMRMFGYEIRPNIGYLEEIEGKSEDEIEEIKANRKANRSSGKTSKEYKAEQEAKKIRQEAEVMRWEAKKKQQEAKEILREAEEILRETERERQETEKNIQDMYDSARKKIDRMEYHVRESLERTEQLEKSKQEEYNKIVIARMEYENLPAETKQYAALWLDHIGKTRNLDDIFSYFNSNRNDPPEIEKLF